MVKTSPIKILIITHEYPPIGGGGGKVAQSLCEGIASEDFKFHVLTSHFENLKMLENFGNLTIERIPSHRKMRYRANLATMMFFVWKSFWRSLKIIRSWKPDMIHAHFAVPGGASAAAAGLITQTPYMITIHGGDVPGAAPEKTRKWFKFILPFTHFIWKNANNIVAVSQRPRKLAQKYYPVKIDVIPNGINVAKYQNIPSTLQDPPMIMFIGRFSPEKNSQLVPKILSHVSDLNWKCKMIGDGLQKDLIQSLVIEYSLEDRIKLTGWISPGEVDQALLDCDILLMPSFAEGMPIAGLQALASGAALIMSNVGACPDMVDVGKNGYLIQPDKRTSPTLNRSHLA